MRTMHRSRLASLQPQAEQLSLVDEGTVEVATNVKEGLKELRKATRCANMRFRRPREQSVLGRCGYGWAGRSQARIIKASKAAFGVGALIGGVIVAAPVLAAVGALFAGLMRTQCHCRGSCVAAAWGDRVVSRAGVAAAVGAGVAGAAGGAAVAGGANKLWVDSIKREQAEQDRFLGIATDEGKGSDFASSVKSFFSFDKRDRESGESSAAVSSKASTSANDPREGREGFICPICKSMQSSAYILEQHFSKCSTSPWNA
jgi:hypothetical protein